MSFNGPIYGYKKIVCKSIHKSVVLLFWAMQFVENLNSVILNILVVIQQESSIQYLRHCRGMLTEVQLNWLNVKVFCCNGMCMELLCVITGFVYPYQINEI